MFSPGGGPAHDIEHQLLLSRMATDEAAIATQVALSDVWANRPGSPANNQLFTATDRQTQYFWNAATSRWFTTQLFEVELLPTATWARPTVLAASGSTFGVGVPAILPGLSTASEYQVWYCLSVVATAATLDATHFWSSNFAVIPATGAATEVIGTILRTAAQTTAGTIYTFVGAGNGVVYTTTTGAAWDTVNRNTINGSVGAGTGNLTVYKQSVFIRIAG